jgi:sulfate-transporting ATPase
MSEKIIYSMIGVGKTYPPNKQVLRDISLSYFYGAKIGVLGLNGAGKSTLLRIMAGVEKEYQGETVLIPGYRWLMPCGPTTKSTPSLPKR